MNYLMVVTVDINDGDYIDRQRVIDESKMKKLRSLFTKVKNAKVAPYKDPDGYDWRGADRDPKDMYFGSLTTEDIEEVNGLCPYGEYGFHTIDSIKFYPLAGEVDTISVDMTWNRRSF